MGIESGAAIDVKAAIDAGVARALTGITNGRTPDLAKAYVKFWNSVRNVEKNAQNPHLKNRYADLEATLKVAKPALAANGLALLIMPGEATSTAVTLTTMLVHESGQSWVWNTTMPMKPPKAGPAGPQEMGSVISYARRYITQAVAGMAAVDDDAEAASQTDEMESIPTDIDLIGKNIITFQANPGESGKDAAERFKAELEAKVSAAGDAKLAAAYIEKRKALRSVK